MKKDFSISFEELIELMRNENSEDIKNSATQRLMNMYDIQNNVDCKLRLAEHSKNPVILYLLSKEKSSMIKSIIADNLYTPQEVLISLSQEDEEVIIESVCNNIHTPVKALKKIIQRNDVKPYIKKIALDNIKKRIGNNI